MQTEYPVVVTFESFRETCRHLAAMIELKYKPKRLFGVSRGGLLSALWMSHYIDRKISIFPIYVNVDCWNCKTPHIVDDPVVRITEKDIIIDDIYDSGNTYINLKKKYKNNPMVFVFSKKKDFNSDSSKNIIVGDQILTNQYLYLPFENQYNNHLGITYSY